MLQYFRTVVPNSISLLFFFADQNFYYTAPQARFLPSHYQHDYVNQHQPTFRHTSPGFQQLDSYFPTHRDLQTSDLPVHLQQTLPQYRLTSTNHPTGSIQHFPGTGAHPAPFRPQPDISLGQQSAGVTPSTHQPNYSRSFNKNHRTVAHDDTETFLGQITIESAADLPAAFNSAPFKPSLDFPNTVAKRPVNQNLDESTRNTVSLGFLNHRTRIFAPTQDTDFKNKPQVKDYFVNVNGDVYATGKAARSTTAYPITTLVRRDRYDPLLYKPTTETPANYESISRQRKVTTPHTFDLESLLEEPIDESKRDEQSDHVEVIKSITVPPDQFYTIPSTNESSRHGEEEEDEETDSPEYEYETTEDVTEATNQLMNDLEFREHENNVSDISDNTLKSKDDKGYDVLTMKPSTMVKDDNFKEFVDSTVIDNTQSEEPNTTTISELDGSSEADRIEPKISVVTTKSVINSTIIGAVTPTTPKPSQQQLTSPVTTVNDSSESWIVVASVQTSRSVSGARYLPSPIVEQEERTKLLLNEQSDEEEDHTTDPPKPPPGKTKTSTESLIDKLDRVQSDLSSGLLSDGFNPSGNNIALLTENNVQEKGETTVFDVEMTTASLETTTTHSVVGPPVVIKRFMPNARPTLKQKFQTRPKSTEQPTSDMPQHDEPIRASNETLRRPVVAPDIRKFLPVGYTPSSYVKETQPKTIADILSNAKTTPKPHVVKSMDDLLRKVTIADILAGYKPPETTTVGEEVEDTTVPLMTITSSAATTKKPTVLIAKKDDISAFLPPGYKLGERKDEKSTTEVAKVQNKTSGNIFKDIKKDDVSAFLPPGYKGFKKTVTTTSKPTTRVFVNSSTAAPEIPATNKTKTKVDTLLMSAEPADISKFLPPGYKPRSTTTRKPSATVTTISTSPKEEVLNTSTEVTITSTTASFKVVFPSRPGGGVRKSSSGRLTTPKYSAEDTAVSEKNSSSIAAPTIHKGWPSRATTEFTGWPTPSTTPISIEKLLEKAREAAAAAAAAAAASSSTEDTSTTVSSTTSTTSTTTTQQPTTPGLCRGECDLAGTIKLVGGAKWVPELLDRNTKEWQILANEVQSQLEDVYSKSSVLNKWYKRIRIDGFSEGSVLVDYLVELNDLGAQVDTLTIKRLFHDSLVDDAKAARTASNREPKASDLDENISSDEQNHTDSRGHKSAIVEGHRLGLGNFIVDPAFTDFIVIPKQLQPTIGYADDNVLLPQWAIAVIVIGLASLLFVIIFGVTVLVNRQKSAKKKKPTPLTEDMLHELNKNHMDGGIDNYAADDLYNMEDVWNDRHPYDTKIPKKRSTGSIHGDNSMVNLYDSWKSEWNGYYYNAYYGHPHQQPAGASSTHSGPAYGHHQYNGRRRSDYDTNF